MKLSASKMGSMKAMKASLQKGASNNGLTYMKSIPADGLVVRFLTEPEEWFGFFEYYDTVERKFVPMVEGEILPDGSKPSFRYLANAVNKDDDRVIPVKLPKTAVNALIMKYDKFDTITDRDYELEKHGEGLDTRYDITPLGPSNHAVEKYELADLEKVLIDARKMALGDTDVEVTASGAGGFSDDDLDDDEAVASEPSEHDYGSFKYEDLFPDDGFREDYSGPELESMSLDDLNAILTDWNEIEAGRSSDPKRLIQMVTEYQEGWGDDSDDDESEYAEYDEGELQGMPVADLRVVAADLEIPTEGVDKAGLIEAIIEAAEV